METAQHARYTHNNSLHCKRQHFLKRWTYFVKAFNALIPNYTFSKHSVERFIRFQNSYEQTILISNYKRKEFFMDE